MMHTFGHSIMIHHIHMHAFQSLQCTGAAALCNRRSRRILVCSFPKQPADSAAAGRRGMCCTQRCAAPSCSGLLQQRRHLQCCHYSVAAGHQHCGAQHRAAGSTRSSAMRGGSTSSISSRQPQRGSSSSGCCRRLPRCHSILAPDAALPYDDDSTQTFQEVGFRV